MRVFSLVLILAVLTLSLLRGGLRFPFALALALQSGCMVLSLYPMSSEKTALSYVMSLLSGMIVIIMCSFLRDFLHPELIVLFFCALSVCSYVVWRSVSQLSDIKFAFRQKMPVCYMEEKSHMALRIWMLATDVLLAISLLTDSVLHAVAADVMYVMLYVLMYFVAYTGRVILMKRDNENAVKEIVKGNLRTIPVVEGADDARMSVLYSRVKDLMEEKKPFLDDGFSLNELARTLFSNKTYLSRTINYFSGKNFKQFVNYYRVQYSIQLMEKDPRLKVMELATMSGFHSVVSYNMAFKLYLADTPAAYRRQLSSNLTGRG